MLWAALFLVGVPLGLVLGTVPLALWNRRRAMRAPGAFARKVRELDTSRPPPRAARRRGGRRGRSSRPRYRRGVGTAWWVSNVLVVQGGSGLGGPRLLPVVAGDSIRPVPDGAVRGLGGKARSVLLILADDRLVEVAVAGEDVALLAGPLMARVPAHRN